MSGIEENAKAAPTARWVAAYKTNFWKTLNQPVFARRTKRDVLVCGDDDSAKRIVMQLIEETGFCAVDCGRLENARTLDLMVPLMIELDQRFAGDALSSWKFIHGGA
jgi:predicted dinucleotide-binding enzyme